MPITPNTEAVFTMEPPPVLSMAGISYFMLSHTPFALMSTTRSKVSSSRSRNGFGTCSIPALLKAKSSRPNFLQRPFDEFLDQDRLRDVGRHEESFAPLSPEEPHGLFSFVRSPAGHNDLGSFPRIGDGGGSADSRGRTHYNCHFVLKLVHDDRSPFEGHRIGLK